MKIIIVSDIHGYNTYMSKLIDIIGKEYPDKIISVKGNCDDPNDLDCVSFPVCENYLVLNIDGINWYLTHGHLNYKLPDIDKNDILFNGHTHCYELSRNYINPGSLSLPRMHSEHTYIIYQNKKFTLCDLDGNVINELKI